MTYARIVIVLWVELGCILSTLATARIVQTVAEYERLAAHVEAVEREHIPDYLTEGE